MALDCSTSTRPHFAFLNAVTYTLPVVGFRSLYNIYPRVLHASTSTPEGKASDKIDEGFVFLFEQNKKPDADFEQIKTQHRGTAVISRCGINSGAPAGQLSVRS
jgi:hypothetical protein